MTLVFNGRLIECSCGQGSRGCDGLSEGNGFVRLLLDREAAPVGRAGKGDTRSDVSGAHIRPRISKQPDGAAEESGKQRRRSRRSRDVEDERRRTIGAPRGSG